MYFFICISRPLYVCDVAKDKYILNLILKKGAHIF
jgi:hypothetical protein